jgi:hypothetical protein
MPTSTSERKETNNRGSTIKNETKKESKKESKESKKE